MKKNKEKMINENDKNGVNIKLMLAIWAVVLTIIIAFFIISESLIKDGSVIISNPTYYIIRIVIAFSEFVMSALFSFLLLNHNKTTRQMNMDSNSRSEEFRKISFAASNYSVIDFVDNMLLYEEYKSYTDTLKANKDFTFYLREDNVDLKNILENFDSYTFLTVKIPFRIAEGKNVGAVRISRFKFSKQGKEHRFVPCTGGNNALVLNDETGHRQEVTVNLITKKDSEFYIPDAVVPFVKIKLNLTMFSLLGVAVTGWTELYFTNPQKLEKNGANQYKINSSQFKVSGLPTLLDSVDEDIKIS